MKGTPSIPAAFAGALTYEAPFLIDKLLKDHIVDSRDEGNDLFLEVKRYLVLVELNHKICWQMYSCRVDEVWHQFILFTNEYTNFCNHFFRQYIPHSPSNAPEGYGAKRESSTFDMFRKQYETIFGILLTDAWYDEKSVTLSRRILNDNTGRLIIRGDDNVTDLLAPNGDVLLSINAVARDALGFIVGTGAFYVRELPGNLEDDEKVGLVSALVEHKLVRVG